MINLFIDNLKSEKVAKNTIDAYSQDLKGFEKFLNERGIFKVEEATKSDVASYLMNLKMEGKSKSTVNRKLASVRALYKFLLKEGVVRENPGDGIKVPKIERKPIEYLSVEEIDKLLSMPDTSVKGLRDKALMELMYATGIRVAEVIGLKPEDINLRLGFVTITGEVGKARIIPIGSMAKSALEKYIYEVREDLLKGKEEDMPLFLNYFGQPLTRQGVWKILKKYGEDAGIEGDIKPQVIRNSFAAHMVENGADIKSLQELLGHEDIMATQVFLSVKKNRIKDVYDKAFPRA
ncbi:MAG: tyrosine recombinase [Clostridia bacterium]|nr:tyrosine recombinase [Clostridia bacterium]